MSKRIPATLVEAYRIGIESARANFVPGILLQAVALALVWAYYSIAPFNSFLETLSKNPLLVGPGGAFVSRAFFGGILPGIIMVSFPTLRPRFPLRTILAMTLYWGGMGVVVYGLYVLQARMFGEENGLGVLLAKTAFDQFVYTVFFASILNSFFNFALSRDLSPKRIRADWPVSFLRQIWIPNLLANWVVWCPAMFLIYIFPFPLQIHISGLVGCFWTMLCIQIGLRSSTDISGKRGNIHVG
ncbi:MAG: hypothetical protein IKR48_04305 [Kiritimatiellae bacterium]|nr:hypothetical protein [Kiritimatiellia bacterium]